MQLAEAIALIQHDNSHSSTPVKWADLGCGTGLFTRALANQLPAESTIYAVDTNQASLASLRDYQGITIESIRQDFVHEDWPFADLDGILMANSLHFVKNKLAFLDKAIRYLTESGCFLLVEYDTDTANPWVPYPLSYKSLKQLFEKAGYLSVEKLHEMPSVYRKANLYATLIRR